MRAFGIMIQLASLVIFVVPSATPTWSFETGTLDVLPPRFKTSSVDSFDTNNDGTLDDAEYYEMCRSALDQATECLGLALGDFGNNNVDLVITDVLSSGNTAEYEKTGLGSYDKVENHVPKEDDPSTPKQWRVTVARKTLEEGDKIAKKRQRGHALPGSEVAQGGSTEGEAEHGDLFDAAVQVLMHEVQHLCADDGPQLDQGSARHIVIEYTRLSLMCMKVSELAQTATVLDAQADALAQEANDPALSPEEKAARLSEATEKRAEAARIRQLIANWCAQMQDRWGQFNEHNPCSLNDLRKVHDQIIDSGSHPEIIGENCGGVERLPPPYSQVPNKKTDEMSPGELDELRKWKPLDSAVVDCGPCRDILLP